MDFLRGRWKGLAVGGIAVAILGMLALASRIDDGPPADATTISRAEFDQIQAGMSYDEVVTIIGGPGELTTETTNVAGYHGEMFTFEGEGTNGAQAVIQFSNRTAMEKSQVGLR